MASLQIRNLTKRYGSDTIVRGVDLDVADGELLVIVGPSGCGKTSVLRMIAGLDEPSAGDVRIDGRALADTGPGAWPVAMMFQEAALYPHLRVGENIGFPLRMAGERSSTIRREVAAIAARLGIRPLLGRRPGQLSGGQRQRVAMARSLIRKPEILLMDEPMSNLDAKLRGELRAAIAHLQHDLRITTVYVTHDQTEAMSLGDRIAVMRSGEIVQLDTPERVYAHPADAFVAGFVGSPTINLFAGRVGGDPSGHLTVTIGSSPVPIAPEHRHGLAAWVGRDVVVGVRPHAFRFVDDGAVVDVEHIETIGDRRLVDARLPAPIARVTTGGIAFDHGPTPIVVEAGAADPVGEARWRASHVTVDPTDIHLFDPVSGRSLLEARTRATRAVQPIRVAT